MNGNQQNKEIKIKINDPELKGQYANQIAIMHTREDFVIDFIAMYPPEAIVGARIITNPVSLKRMSNAIAANLKKYEEQFGEIFEEETRPADDKVNWWSDW